MSFVLKMIVQDEEVLYFRGWVKGNRARPEFGAIIRDAKHWTQRAKCRIFHERNMPVLSKYHLEIDRIIKDRFCGFCGAGIDKNTQKSKEYCDDSCRNKYFKAMQ